MTAIRRHPERASAERRALDAILDDSFVATLSTVRDGIPLVVPVMAGRDGDCIIVHGSTGAGALRAAAAGGPVALSVFHLDGLVYADSLFDSSANYRSAVVSGVATVLTGDEAIAALDALSDRLMPGRREEVRRHLPKELAATLVLSLRIGEDNWTAKARSGPPATEATAGVWQGELPIEPRFGSPRAHPGVPESMPVAPSVTKRVGGPLT
jgi:nitroimidazol reductase NimA-like FMN-containing flavoprotein (pyridoxamine 5'-phosphate oxidase superfamily)